MHGLQAHGIKRVARDGGVKKQRSPLRDSLFLLFQIKDVSEQENQRENIGYFTHFFVSATAGHGDHIGNESQCNTF